MMKKIDVIKSIVTLLIVSFMGLAFLYAIPVHMDLQEQSFNQVATW